MKKLICILLIFSFIFTFTACKPKEKPNENTEATSDIKELHNNDIVNIPTKKIGTVGVRVLTDIKYETTSCTVELTYSEEENILWKRNMDNIPVKNTRFDFSILKTTEDKIFINTNNVIYCLATDNGAELWKTQPLSTSVDAVCNTNKYIFVVYQDEQTEAKVDVFDINSGNFISSVIFNDIDYFSSPININVAGENIVIKDSSENTRYLNHETLKIVQEKDYKQREVIVSEKLVLKESNEKSFPKTYLYSYKGYEIYFTISRTFENTETTSEINLENFNGSTVNFLGEKTIAFSQMDNTKVKCTYLYKDGLLYYLTVLTPEVYDPMIFYTITSSFSFK